MVKVSIVCSKCGNVGDSSKWGEKKPSLMRKELKESGWKQAGDHDLCWNCRNQNIMARVVNMRNDIPNWVHIKASKFNHDDFD